MPASPDLRPTDGEPGRVLVIGCGALARELADPATFHLTDRAQRAAARLGLAFERQATGLGELVEALITLAASTGSPTSIHAGAVG